MLIPATAEQRLEAMQQRGLNVELLPRFDYHQQPPRLLGYVCLALGEEQYAEDLALANQRLRFEHETRIQEERLTAGRRREFIERIRLPWADVEQHPLLREDRNAIRALQLSEQAWLDTVRSSYDAAA